MNVTLEVSGGGNLVLGTASPSAKLTEVYPSAAAAVSALSGLIFVSNGQFTGASTLTFTVSTTVNGVSYTATDTIPLLTPNTALVVTQAVDTSLPASPNDFNLTVTIKDPGGLDAQNGTGVKVQESLAPGVSVLSATASLGSYNASTGIWTIGNLPISSTGSATLTLVLQAGASTQGQALASSAQASSALFNYPASAASSLVALQRPSPITITVTNLNDSGTGSLRTAIQAAENGDTIAFSPGLSGTITLTSGELLVNQSLTIVGPTTSTGAPAIEVSGNKASRVFDIQGGTAGVNVTIEDLAIENGLANSKSLNTADAGGGLLINDAGGAVTLTNVLVSGNVAQGSTGVTAQGGGIALLGGTGTFSNDTISGNQAIAVSGTNALGGGLSVSAGALALGTDTIAGNAVTGGNGGLGGGISVIGGGVALSGDTIASNTASTGGDVDQAAPGVVSAVNSIFASSGSTGTAPDFAGTVSFSDHNLVDNTAGSTGFGAANGDVLNVSAGLAALGNHGGPLPTMPPLTGSAAINAGDPVVQTAETLPNLVAYWQGAGSAVERHGHEQRHDCGRHLVRHRPRRHPGLPVRRLDRLHPDGGQPRRPLGERRDLGVGPRRSDRLPGR